MKYEYLLNNGNSCITIQLLQCKTFTKHLPWTMIIAAILAYIQNTSNEMKKYFPPILVQYWQNVIRPNAIAMFHAYIG